MNIRQKLNFTVEIGSDFQSLVLSEEHPGHAGFGIPQEFQISGPSNFPLVVIISEHHGPKLKQNLLVFLTRYRFDLRKVD